MICRQINHVSPFPMIELKVKKVMSQTSPIEIKLLLVLILCRNNKTKSLIKPETILGKIRKSFKLTT